LEVKNAIASREASAKNGAWPPTVKLLRTSEFFCPSSARALACARNGLLEIGFVGAGDGINPVTAALAPMFDRSRDQPGMRRRLNYALAWHIPGRSRHRLQSPRSSHAPASSVGALTTFLTGASRTLTSGARMGAALCAPVAVP